MPTKENIEGVVAVMLTPFSEDGTVDWNSLSRLVDWYIDHGVETLFSVCQSSEMYFLSLEERVQIARFVIDKAHGRARVAVSGHVSDDIDAQIDELQAMSETSPDALVLTTSLLDRAARGGREFTTNLERIVDKLPGTLDLGLYECPHPYRRLLTEDEFRTALAIDRFVLLKDVSCDLETVRRRVEIAGDARLSVINANGPIALEAFQAGSRGYSGVFTNFHPDLYVWMYRNWRTYPQLCRELSAFLVTTSVSELMGYPELAKRYLVNLGIVATTHTRSISYDLEERFWWGVPQILRKIDDGTELYRARIAQLS